MLRVLEPELMDTQRTRTRSQWIKSLDLVMTFVRMPADFRLRYDRHPNDGARLKQVQPPRAATSTG